MDFIDHGDPAVDERWRRLLGGDPVQRHASLAGAVPPMMDPDDDPHCAPEDFVPPEFHAEGRSTVDLCKEIVPDWPEILERALVDSR